MENDSCQYLYLLEGDQYQKCSVEEYQCVDQKQSLYLFEDAGKSKRPTLFEGAKPNHNRYSGIREEFANKGMRIFHEDISNKVHYYHNVDEAKQQEQNNKGETYEGSQP